MKAVQVGPLPRAYHRGAALSPPLQGDTAVGRNEASYNAR